jgi:hypothetical protein
LATTWFVTVGGKTHGPFDGARLKALARAGKIARSTPVGKTANGPWNRADAIRGLFQEPAPAVLPAPGPPPLASARPAVPLPEPIFSVAPPLPPVPEFPMPALTAPPDPSEPAPRVAETQTKGRLARLWGGVGGFVGVAVIIYNIWAAVHNGYLHTDKAAADLIKSSMQETFSGDSDLTQPVTVLEVALNKGSGTNRTGTAQVQFGRATHSIAFQATVTHSGRELKVNWQTDNLPLANPNGEPATPPPPRRPATSQQPVVGSPHRPSVRNRPSLPSTASRTLPPPAPSSPLSMDEFQELNQAFVMAASELAALESQLGNEGVERTLEEEVELLQKLSRGWDALRKSSVAMRRRLEAAAPAEMPEELQKLLMCLAAVESATPAILKIIDTIRVSDNEAEIQAMWETYGSLSEGVGTACEKLAPE